MTVELLLLVLTPVLQQKASAVPLPYVCVEAVKRAERLRFNSGTNAFKRKAPVRNVRGPLVVFSATAPI